MNTIRLVACTLSVLFLVNYSAFCQFQIGHKQVTYQDPARNNRSIQTEIYYPAVTAGENVAVANGQFPIIVFGHGFVMVWSAYQNFWDSIVPRGYIMAFPRTEGSMSPNHGEYGLDLAFLITKLKSEGMLSTSFLYQKVAQTSAISGHSMGGGASFLAAKNNTEITAMIVFAAANTNPSSITAAQNITVPSVIFYGENDGVTPPVEHQIPMYDSLASACKTRIGILGGGHCYFANTNVNCSAGEGFTSPQPTISRDEQHTIVMSLLLPYLDFILKGDGTAETVYLNRLNTLSTITFQRSCSSTKTESNPEGNSSFILFPNPVNDILSISYANSGISDENFNISLINNIGQVVFETNQKLGLESSINLNSVAKGLYTLCIRSKKNQKFEKVILQ